MIAPSGPVLARRAAFAATMALLIVPNLSHLHPDHYRDVDLHSGRRNKSPTRGIEVTSRAEYRPRWMLDVAPYRPDPVTIVSGDAEVQTTDRAPQPPWSGMIHAQASSASGNVHCLVPQAGGCASTDVHVPAWPADRTGLIRFDATAGDHRVSSYLTRGSPPVWIGRPDQPAGALCILIAAAVIRPRRP